jgi:hypothetical protein
MTAPGSDHLSPADPLLLDTMGRFGSQANDLLSGGIRSILLHGSLVLQDFRIGRGDLDFVTILLRSLDSSECRALFAFHDALRDRLLGELGRQLEGIYSPMSFFRPPQSANARGCYIGTRRVGWKELHQPCTNTFETAVMACHGIVAYGADCRSELPRPSRCAILQDIYAALQASVARCADPTGIGFAVHLLLMIPRGLYFLHTNSFIGKTGACLWYLEHEPTSPWSDDVAGAVAERQSGHADGRLRLRTDLAAEAARFATEAMELVAIELTRLSETEMKP